MPKTYWECDGPVQYTSWFQCFATDTTPLDSLPKKHHSESLPLPKYSNIYTIFVPKTYFECNGPVYWFQCFATDTTPLDPLPRKHHSESLSTKKAICFTFISNLCDFHLLKFTQTMGIPAYITLSAKKFHHWMEKERRGRKWGMLLCC